MEECPFDTAALPPLLRRHGSHSLAYSILQPGLRYFGDPARGVVAYRRCLGHSVVLGDPVCEPLFRGALLEGFLAAHPRAVFMQVHGGTARRLAGCGLRVLPVGVENQLDPRTFHLRGRAMEDLRHYRNRGRAAGLRIEEVPDGDETRRMLADVSRAWLGGVARRGRVELRFLARPLAETAEAGVRIFLARHKARPVGFVLMDPIYEDGACIGYSAALLRRVLEAPEGTLDCVNLHAIEVFRREGRQVFSLGVSPLHALARHAGTHGRAPLPAYWLFRALYRWGGPIFSFRGLSFHKRRYRGREVPVYAAMPGAFGLAPCYAAARVCRML